MRHSFWGGIIFLVLELGLRSFWRLRQVGIANQGIGFGLRPGIEWWLLATALIGLIVYQLQRGEKRAWEIDWIIFGGLANAVDRFWWASVWDYLYLPGLNLWINGADLMIGWGLAWWTLKSLKLVKL